MVINGPKPCPVSGSMNRNPANSSSPGTANRSHASAADFLNSAAAARLPSSSPGSTPAMLMLPTAGLNSGASPR